MIHGIIRFGSARLQLGLALALLACAPAMAGVHAEGVVAPSTPPTAWTGSTEVVIGDGGVGSVSVDAGSRLETMRSFLGKVVNGVENFDPYDYEGVVSLSGPGTTWENNHNLYVGYTAAGLLNITDQASFFGGLTRIGAEASGVGNVVVEGYNSYLRASRFDVGDYGIGSLVVSDGGVACGSFVLGRMAGSSGTLTVDGADSLLLGGDVTVGIEGDGLLNITNKAQLICDELTLANTYNYPAPPNRLNFGPRDGGTVDCQHIAFNKHQVRGSGSIYTRGVDCDLDLRFDQSDSGVGSATFETGPGQSVELTVDSTWDFLENTNDLKLGDTGGGSLVILNDAVVGCRNCVLRGSELESIVNGGRLRCKLLDLGCEGAIAAMGIFGDGSVMCQSLRIGCDGTWGWLRMEGSVEENVKNCSLSVSGFPWPPQYSSSLIGDGGTGTVAMSHGATLTVSNHTLIVGRDGHGEIDLMNVGTRLRVDQALQLESAKVTIRRGALVQIGQLAMEDDVQIQLSAAGQLAIEGVPADPAGFLAALDKQGKIFIWSYVDSEWLALENAREGVDYTLEAVAEGDLAGCTLLTALPMVGDVTLSSRIDINDFIRLKGNYGKENASRTDGDLNGDGRVDVADFIILKQHYNEENVPTGQ